YCSLLPAWCTLDTMACGFLHTAWVIAGARIIRSQALKLFGYTAFCVCVGLLVASLAAWYLQGYLIYHPRPYSPGVLAALPPSLVEIAYDTAQGPQKAFYLPPYGSPTNAPDALWVV